MLWDAHARHAADDAGADDALAHAARNHGLTKRFPFAERLRRLVQIGAVPASDESRWNALRRLRNHATYQESQQIWSPADAVRTARTVAELLALLEWNEPDAIVHEPDSEPGAKA